MWKTVYFESAIYGGKNGKYFTSIINHSVTMWDEIIEEIKKYSSKY